MYLEHFGPISLEMKETIYLLFVPWVFSQYQVSGRLSSVHDKVWQGYLFRCTNMSPTLLPADVRCDGYPDCPGKHEIFVIKFTKTVFRRRGWAGMWASPFNTLHAWFSPNGVKLCVTDYPRNHQLSSTTRMAWGHLSPVPVTPWGHLCPAPAMLQSPARTRSLSPLLDPAHSEMVL